MTSRPKAVTDDLKVKSRLSHGGQADNMTRDTNIGKKRQPVGSQGHEDGSC